MQTLRLHPCAGRGRSNGKARESSLVASLGLERYGNKTSQLRWMRSCMGSFGIHIRSFWGQLSYWGDMSWYELIDHKAQDPTFGQRQEAPERAHHQAACLGTWRVETKPNLCTMQNQNRTNQIQGAKELRSGEHVLSKVQWNSAFSHLMFSWAHPW